MLTTNIEKMESNLASLTAKRQRLEQLYKGPAATVGFEAIKKREREAASSIEKYRGQRDKLQEYLDLMNTTDAQVTTTYEEALSETNDFFKS